MLNAYCQDLVLIDSNVYQKLAGASILIFANKQDLPGALPVTSIAEILQLDDAQFSNRHWKIVSCSAISGDGLAEGIDWLVQDIASRIFLMDWKWMKLIKTRRRPSLFIYISKMHGITILLSCKKQKCCDCTAKWSTPRDCSTFRFRVGMRCPGYWKPSSYYTVLRWMIPEYCTTAWKTFLFAKKLHSTPVSNSNWRDTMTAPVNDARDTQSTSKYK